MNNTTCLNADFANIKMYISIFCILWVTLGKVCQSLFLKLKFDLDLIHIIN